MKRVIIWMACTIAIAITGMCLLTGGYWSLVGFALCGMLYLSGLAMPRIWKTYWLTNARILSYFGSL